MKRSFNGRVYDTEKAELVATFHNGYAPSDFHYVEESLYRSAKGNWFIAGEGGALSSYRTMVGNGYGAGADIKPLSPEDAMDWLEIHNFVAEIEEHFAGQIEEA